MFGYPYVVADFLICASSQHALDCSVADGFVDSIYGFLLLITLNSAGILDALKFLNSFVGICCVLFNVCCASALKLGLLEGIALIFRDSFKLFPSHILCSFGLSCYNFLFYFCCLLPSSFSLLLKAIGLRSLKGSFVL